MEKHFHHWAVEMTSQSDFSSSVGGMEKKKRTTWRRRKMEEN
jgi:hypothetical protein